MANSYVEYTSLSGTTYATPNFLNINDINVKGYNGSTWTTLTINSRDASAKTITLSAAPSSYQKIRVYRSTTADPLVDFVDGALLTASNLDSAYNQGLFVAQEVSEDAGAVGSTSTTNLSLSGTTTVANLKITNIPRFEVGFSNDDTANVGTANGSDYRITFTQEIVDTNNDFSDGHTFTAPVTGLYMFYGNLYTTYTSDQARTGVALYVNGSLKYKNWNANHETETTASISMPIYLNATNTVDLRMSLTDANGASNTYQIYRNGIYSNFGGYLIG